MFASGAGLTLFLRMLSCDVSNYHDRSFRLSASHAEVCPMNHRQMRSTHLEARAAVELSG